MAELEQALIHDDEGDGDDAGGSGVDGLDALGVNVDELDPPPRRKDKRQRGDKRGGEQRRREDADFDDDDDDLSPEEWKRRERQKSAALREEREARRRDREEIADVRSKFDRLVGMIQAGRVQGFQGQAAEEPIDIRKHPLKALEAMAAKIQQYEEGERQRHTQTEAQRKEAVAVSNGIKEMRRAEAEFKLDTPDYDHAAAHYIKTRMTMAQAQGFSQEAAQKFVMRELLQTGAMAREMGKNPAELIYAAARVAGYRRARPGDDKRGGDQRRPVSGRPAPRYRDDEHDDDVYGGDADDNLDRVDRIERGRRSGRGHGSGGSGGGRQERGGVPNLLELNGEEFDKNADAFLKRMRRGGR